jgi:hypothetical protein
MNRRQPAPAAHVSFPTWKADAVKALRELHERAAVAMRERDWRNLYVRGLSPDEAASHAAREYDSTHRPDWVKTRR